MAREQIVYGTKWLMLLYWLNDVTFRYIYYKLSQITLTKLTFFCIYFQVSLHTTFEHKVHYIEVGKISFCVTFLEWRIKSLNYIQNPWLTTLNFCQKITMYVLQGFFTNFIIQEYFSTGSFVCERKSSLFSLMTKCI